MLLSNEENAMKESSQAGSDVKTAARSGRGARLFTGGIIVVVALGFGLRYALVLQDAVINEDGIYYVLRAKTLMAGDFWNGISAYWSPLYSLLTGLVGEVAGDFELGGRIVSLIAGALLILTTYYLTERLYNKGTALIASLLVATHGSLILSSRWAMTESLYTFLFVAMILSGWSALDRNKLVNWFVTGLLFGLLYLTKPEALAFLLLIVFFAAILIVLRRTEIRQRVHGVVLMCLVTSAFVIPYVLFLHAKVGEWTLSKKVSTNLPSTLEEDQRLKLINGGTQTMMDQIWGDEYAPANAVGDRSTANTFPGDASPNWESRFYWAYYLFKLQIVRYIPSLIPAVFIPFMIIGLFGNAWRRSDAVRNLYLGSFVLAMIVGYSFAVTNIRYLFAIIPVLLIFTAYGVIIFGRWAAKTLTNISAGAVKIPSIAFSVLGVLALVVSSLSSVRGLFVEPAISSTPVEERTAGLWLRSQNVGEGTRIMSSHAGVAYYAGAEHSFLPNEDLATIIEYARRRGADFLVFSRRRLPRNKQSFPEVSENEQLQLVYSDVAGEGFEVRIYKLRSAS